MGAEDMDRLFRSVSGFLRCRDRTELTARIVDAFCQTLGFGSGLLRLRDPKDDRFVLWASTGLGASELSEGRFDDLDLEGMEQTLAACRRVGGCYLKGEGPATRLHCPLLGAEAECIGLIELVAPRDGHIDPQSLPWVGRLAEVAALALESMASREELTERIRELSTAETQIEELKTRQEEFLDGVSHELRTPLTSIQAYCEGLLNDDGGMEPVLTQQFLGVILQESRRLQDRVEDLLAIARGESGPSPSSRRRRFDLAETVRKTRQRMEPFLREKKLEGLLCLPEEPVYLDGEPEAIAQIAQELLENAIKFSPEGGTIRVSVLEDDGEVELRVEDCGEGVPESEMERIFERFYQVDGTATRSHGGQGLGLSLCRRIVEEHEGRIWVERVEAGGALFRVRLPRQRAILRTALAREVHRGARSQLLDLLDLSVALVSELMSCGIASIMTYDEREDCLRVQAAVGLSEEVVRRTRVEAGSGVAGWVFKTGETVWVPDLRKDDRFGIDLNEQQYDGYSVLSTPLRTDGRIIGVLNANNKLAGETFDDDDRLLLESLARRISTTFSHYRSFESSHEVMVKVRDALRAAVDFNHRRRTPLREAIVRCGLATARRAGAGEDELRTLSFALRIYDLGLFVAGADVPARTEPLAAEERRLIQEHARRGAELGDVLESDEMLRLILAHHHENWDGRGYPDGLAGELIPRGARIVRLVDAFSAMLHGRIGRPPVDVVEALALVEEALGRRFCPHLGAVFLEEARTRCEELIYLARWQEENGPRQHESGPEWPRSGKLPAIQPSIPAGGRLVTAGAPPSLDPEDPA